MKKYFENLAKALLGMSFNDLGSVKKEIIQSIADGSPIAENVNQTYQEQLSFGDKLADRISTFGGSWTFIIIFLLVIVMWIIINVFYFTSVEEAFDPYPFILLNLVLSTLAAIQAPIIMMSQNRQTAKDRMEAEENYKVSLKTDLEIIRLHTKIDDLIKQLSNIKK